MGCYTLRASGQRLHFSHLLEQSDLQGVRLSWRLKEHPGRHAQGWIWTRESGWEEQGE